MYQNYEFVERIIREQSFKKLEKSIHSLQQLKNYVVDHSNLSLKIFQFPFLSMSKEQKEYTIKLVVIDNDDHSDREKKLAEMQNISQKLQSMNHPNLIKCYDYFYLDPCFIMQLDSCKISLEDWYVDKQTSIMTKYEYIQIALQILETARYLHSNNLILCDYNRQTILMNQDGCLKFTCFRELDKEEQDQRQNQEKSEIIEQFEDLGLKQNCRDCIEKKSYKQNKRSKIDELKAEDILKIGECLYLLAGGDQEKISQIASKDNEQILRVDDDIKDILILLLKYNANGGYSSTTLENIIQIFKQINENSEEMTGNPINIFYAKEDSIFQEVQDLFEKQKFSLCISLLKQLIKHHPKNDKYFAWLGRSYVATQNINEGKQMSLQSLQLNPNNDLAYFNLGNIHSDLLNIEAVYYYQKALEIKPNAEKVHFNLGVFYSRNGMSEQAINSYKNAIKINENYYSAYNNLGSIYETTHQYDKAIFCFQQAIKISPSKEEAYNNLGVAYYSKKNFEKSIYYFKKALSISPTSPKYQLNLLISKNLQ